jgi:aspartate carbamoyltransferase catalytic subunit
MGRSLLSTEDLDAREVLAILDQAALHKRQLQEAPPASRPLPLRGRLVANLFFEPSTRTRLSFEIAAKRLGAEVVNWTRAGTSSEKGESTLDSVKTIAAMRPDVLVVRHPSSGVPALLVGHVQCPVLNAGDGTHQHPSQALLDALTLREALGELQGRTVAIVGDISHSRVARSHLFCLPKLGVRLRLCGPPSLLPAGIERLAPEGLVSATHSLAEALKGVDAVMLLRIQKERQAEVLYAGDGEYNHAYGLNERTLGLLPDRALILHPGPFNPGVEITPDLAVGPRSLILKQVENGVPMRMALLERAVSS